MSPPQICTGNLMCAESPLQRALPRWSLQPMFLSPKATILRRNALVWIFKFWCECQTQVHTFYLSSLRRTVLCLVCLQLIISSAPQTAQAPDAALPPDNPPERPSPGWEGPSGAMYGANSWPLTAGV